ncbi:uncharacterized protein IL334_005157 [Kwoniella shivajii]|uniref:Hemerythrin-like domain-containing protein n=1 Tax=Kwoniella shivajii TaxID=564305 RepID=A0ABZ1D2D4_9TREE|nr:hypothetical protein IL334_005157 [Kwoniella shivajii]
MSSISQVIIHDHKELEEYYNNIISSTTKDDKIRWQNQFTWELARHSIGEELVVYPAFEKYLADGKAMADQDRAEHAKAKELLYKFQSLSPDQSEFEPTIKKLWSELTEHIKGEEQDDLPKLEKSLPGEESANLAASFQNTKKFVPTRSHPSAPDKPPFETVAGLLAAPMDKLGDLFRKFPKE